MRIVCFGIMILVVIDRVGFVVIMFRYNNGEVFIIKMVYIKEFFLLLILFLNVSILFNVGSYYYYRYRFNFFRSDCM